MKDYGYVVGIRQKNCLIWRRNDIWSDETKFMLFGTDGIIYVCHTDIANATILRTNCPILNMEMDLRLHGVSSRCLEMALSIVRRES